MKPFLRGDRLSGWAYDGRWFKCSALAGLAWFRLFGYGVIIKETRRHPLLFSERNGMRKQLQVGPFSLRGLRP